MERETLEQILWHQTGLGYKYSWHLLGAYTDREINIDVNVGIHIYAHIFLSSAHSETGNALTCGAFSAFKEIREKTEKLVQTEGD